jgi:pimeloyl-ACP methyl ester carboxylesterase
MKSQVSQTSKGSIEYTLLGSGPVVLVCHGTSSNCFSTDLAGPLVESGFSVLTPSRPGYGRTPLEAGRTAAEAAQALIALLDSLQIQTCSVVAISGGGPTGIALAAGFSQRVERLVLVAAISRPEDRPNEPNYKNQVAFYGPMHRVMWGMLGFMSRLSSKDIEKISRFYQGRSSRVGALIDATHTVGNELLRAISQPTLVVHSREDNSVPFSHAEWSLGNIPHAELFEAGFTGHFFWGGPDFGPISQRMVEFLREKSF